MPTLPGRLESLYINVYLYAGTYTEANMQATAQPSSFTTAHAYIVQLQTAIRLLLHALLVPKSHSGVADVSVGTDGTIWATLLHTTANYIVNPPEAEHYTIMSSALLAYCSTVFVKFQGKAGQGYGIDNSALHLVGKSVTHGKIVTVSLCQERLCQTCQGSCGKLVH